MVKNNNHLVIMAGGVGSRFWPTLPKKHGTLYCLCFMANQVKESQGEHCGIP